MDKLIVLFHCLFLRGNYRILLLFLVLCNFLFSLYSLLFILELCNFLSLLSLIIFIFQASNFAL